MNYHEITEQFKQQTEECNIPICKKAVKVIESYTKRLSPCDVCKHYPPSSSDDKPCTLCPADVKESYFKDRNYKESEV